MLDLPGCHGVAGRAIHYGKPGAEMLAARRFRLRQDLSRYRVILESVSKRGPYAYAK